MLPIYSIQCPRVALRGLIPFDEIDSGTPIHEGHASEYKWTGQDDPSECVTNKPRPV